MKIERTITAGPRPIFVYEKEPHLRSSEEKWGVEKLPRSEREKKRLLVLGSGRSGTMFTAKALRTVGINVLHEKVGEHGTVSHYFALDSAWYPMAPWQESQDKKHVGERRSDFEFERTIHIMRDPRKAIPSMTKIFGMVTWQFYVDNGLIPDIRRNPMLRAMHYWLAHNELSESQADLTFNLENYHKAWPAMMEVLGENAPYPRHLKPMNKTSGFRSYEPVTFADLISVDAALGKRIKAYAKKHGYK